MELESIFFSIFLWCLTCNKRLKYEMSYKDIFLLLPVSFFMVLEQPGLPIVSIDKLMANKNVRIPNFLNFSF